jgi:hypothetical protein
MVLLLIPCQLLATNCTACKTLTLALTFLTVEDDVSRYSSVTSRCSLSMFPDTSSNILQFPVHWLHQGCGAGRQKFKTVVFQTI